MKLQIFIVINEIKIIRGELEMKLSRKRCIKNKKLSTYIVCFNILIIIVSLYLLIKNKLINVIITQIIAILANIIYYVAVKYKRLKMECENLKSSNERIQNNYDSIRSFRHDFNNIMQGIGGYIAINDIEGLKKMYSSIIEECQEITDSQAINEDVINNPAVYNLINNKINVAKKDGVKLKINVYIDLNSLNISSYDLCRMLGILIDNAVEAAKVCEDKTVYIKFIKDKLNNRNLVIVENPYKNYLIDIKKIYEKGFSSKRDALSHGLGLWKVKQILKKNKNIQIYTSRDKLFKQQLEIY